MLDLNNDLFKIAASRLVDYYPLVKLVNSRDVLTADDLKPYFDESFVDEVLHLQHAYLESGKTRACGNPSFVHSLRCLIWAKALNCDVRTARIVLYHDYAEDFSKSIDDFDRLIEAVPEDLRLPANFLTNKYRLILKSLDLTQGVPFLVKQLSDFSSHSYLDIPVTRITSELAHITGKVMDYFLIYHYDFYLADLVDHVSSSGDDSIIVGKLLDRLDNTMTDLPSKFEAIIKLYHKNALVLKSFSDYVKQSSNPLIKFLYILLYVRSIDQVLALRRHYAHIADVRGDFYGQQFLKLCNSLDLEGHKIGKFEHVARELLDDASVVDLINSLR